MIALSDAQIAGAAIAIDTAAAARIDTFIRMPGEVTFNEERTAHVSAGVDGVVQAVQAQLGQTVARGALLASIASAAVAQQRSDIAAAEARLRYARANHATERQLWQEQISARQDFLKAEQELREADAAVRGARQKLAAVTAGGDGGDAGDAGGVVSNRLALRAPFAGLVVEKHIAPGEMIAAATRLYTIVDLSTVWVDVVVPAKDLGVVRVGTSARLHSTASSASATGTVSFVSAVIGEQSRAARARVVLANPQLAWRPGLFVDVDIVTGAAVVPVAIDKRAVQTVDGRQVVFIKEAGGFRAQAVTLGRSDGKLVEIVSGMQAGQRYAGAGSFTIKAEQGKGEAGHED